MSNTVSKTVTAATDNDDATDAYAFASQRVAHYEGRGLCDVPPGSPFDNRKWIARLVDVYDGDTVTCVVALPAAGQQPSASFDTYHRVVVRLLDVDACELRATSTAAREFAYRARDRVVSYLTGGAVAPRPTIPRSSRAELQALLDGAQYLVGLDLRGLDKYGRSLGHVHPYDCRTGRCLPSVSSVLLRERLATEYHGGARLPEDEEVAALDG